MSRSTEWLFRGTLVLLILYFGWAVVSQTVVQLIQQNAQIAQLQQQLQHAQSTPAIAGGPTK